MVVSGLPNAMALGRQRRPFLGSLDPTQEADSLLRVGLDDATKAKKALAQALLLLNPRPIVPSLGPGATPTAFSLGAPVAGDSVELPLKDLTCEVRFNAQLGLTTMIGGARVRRPGEFLAPILDPRSWSCSGGVIAAAFIVEADDRGNYAPDTKLDTTPLGEPWEDKLLYEYARSEVASFENILRIKKFQVSKELIRADYQLHDCLVCTLGCFSAPGGLIVNQGHVQATQDPADKAWWRIEVLKNIQVRDLTPHDPGNGYDFGESVNTTIGAALSQWVHDTSLMRPVL